MTDLDIIEQIETELNINFTPQSDKVDSINNEYFINKSGQIERLSIFAVGLKQIGLLHSKLKALENLIELGLIGLDITDVSWLSDFENLTSLDLW